MRYVPFTTPAQETTRRLDELRFRFGKWDLHVDGRNTIAPGALVLERDEHKDVVRLSEGLYEASLAMQERIHGDAHRRQEAGAGWPLGLDATAQHLASSQVPGPFVTRVDLFKTADGWRASECNDDCPGGYNEAIGLPALFHDAVPEGLAVAGDLPEALCQLAAPSSEGEALGIVYATGYSEDLQVVEMLARLFASAGNAVVAGSPAHLAHADGVTTLLGQPVGRILRFFPSEWFHGLPNLDAWSAALQSGLGVANPFPSAWSQSKAAFGWMQQNLALEGGVSACLPQTVPFDDTSHAVALDAPHDWVLKPAFGRMGGGVVLGDMVHRDAWAKHLTAAARDLGNRPFVMQRRFRPEPVETAPGVTATPCIGAYVVAGRFAGYYSRLAVGPLVAYNATNILTVVEGL